jgi:integrase
MHKIGAITKDKQKKFVKWSLEVKAHAISYVARNLGVLASALVHAALSVRIIYNEGAILAEWPELNPKPKREIYEPTDEELARFLAAKIPENLRRWILNSMATAGRPEAVRQLGPAQRVRDLGLIELNVPGRRQNKKYLATVRELRVQTRWLNKWERKDLKLFGGRYCGYVSVDSVDTALRRWRIKKEVNVPEISAYSIRHRATSVLRASKNPRVPGEQVSYQLGHRRPAENAEARTTRGYGQFGPEYLTEAAKVLDAWITRVLALAAKQGKRKAIQPLRGTA